MRSFFDLNPVNCEPVNAVVERGEGERTGTNVIVRALQQVAVNFDFNVFTMIISILGSSEDVGLSRDPVDVLVVKASREAAGGFATDLEGQTDKVNNTKTTKSTWTVR